MSKLGRMSISITPEEVEERGLQDVGYRNMTLHCDEVERAVGLIAIHIKKNGLVGAELAYAMGAKAMLETLMLMPSDHASLVTTALSRMPKEDEDGREPDGEVLGRVGGMREPAAG